MNPQLQKQIGVGALAGIVLAGLIYFLLGGKRTDLEATVCFVTDYAMTSATLSRTGVGPAKS